MGRGGQYHISSVGRSGGGQYHNSSVGRSGGGQYHISSIYMIYFLADMTHAKILQNSLNSTSTLIM